MIPYYLLVAAPFLMSVIQFESQARQMINKKKNWPILIFFAIYAILLALRHMSVGVDTAQYSMIFDRNALTDWTTIFRDFDKEIGYALLNKIVSFLQGNYQLFLGIVAAITVIPLAKLYFDESENAMVSVSLFLIFPVFIMNFSGIRQGIAVSIGAIAYYAVKKKKLLPFILLVLLAISFHRSAFILILLYPLYHMRLRKAYTPFILGVIGLVYLFNEELFRLVVPLLGEDYADRLDSISDNGAYAMIILMVLFLLYAFIAPDENLMDRDTVALRNIMVLVTVLQMFVPLDRLAMRLNYYYLIFVPLLIPRVTNRFKVADKFITNVINIVMIVFFIGYFFLVNVSADNLGIFPYRFFWA